MPARHVNIGTLKAEVAVGEGGSGRQLIAAVVLIAALIAVGLWLSGTLRQTGAIQDCVMAGRTNCTR